MELQETKEENQRNNLRKGGISHTSLNQGNNITIIILTILIVRILEAKIVDLENELIEERNKVLMYNNKINGIENTRSKLYLK